MTVLSVDGLTFTFPEEWAASKYDEWAYYRKQFCRQGSGIAAVDIVVASPQRHAFLVEVKDYRHPRTIKPSELPEALANKVRCTLAALIPAKIHATSDEERSISQKIAECRELSVVLHIELPRAHVPVIDLADLKQELRVKLKAIDPHFKIVSMRAMRNIEWTVS